MMGSNSATSPSPNSSSTSLNRTPRFSRSPKKKVSSSADEREMISSGGPQSSGRAMNSSNELGIQKRSASTPAVSNVRFGRTMECASTLAIA